MVSNYIILNQEHEVQLLIYMHSGGIGNYSSQMKKWLTADYML